MALKIDKGGFFKNHPDFESSAYSYGIKLTPEQAKLIKGKTPRIYSIDGGSIFSIMNEGHLTDEVMIYVVFE